MPGDGAIIFADLIGKLGPDKCGRTGRYRVQNLIEERGPDPTPSSSGTFGVSYHETFDFFWIEGALRCEANNFLGYDFD